MYHRQRWLCRLLGFGEYHLRTDCTE